MLRSRLLVPESCGIDAFVIYARLDEVIAGGLVSDLRGHGFSAGWDRDLIAIDGFRKQIEELLQRVGATIVIWSPNAVASNFVVDEAEVSQKRGRLISTLAPGADPATSIPLGFRSHHCVSVLETDEIIRALAELGVVPLTGG